MATFQRAVGIACGTWFVLAQAAVWSVSCSKVDEAKPPPPTDSSSSDSDASTSANPDADAAAPKALSPIGGACTTNGECGEGNECWGATAKGMPGGYCVRADCKVAGCPANSVCFEFSSGAPYCLATCKTDTNCRTKEEYSCVDGDGAGTKVCWGAKLPGFGCSSDSQCAGGTNAFCFTSEGWPNGYCSVSDCVKDADCPETSVCRKIYSNSNGQVVGTCMRSCAADADCRIGYDCSAADGPKKAVCTPGCTTDKDCPTPLGCRENRCIDTSNECGAKNPDGDCTAGSVCNGGKCEVFQCVADALERDDDRASTKPFPTAETNLTVCAGDHDWLTYTPSEPDQLHIVGFRSALLSGDLHMDPRNEAGTVLGDSDVSRDYFQHLGLTNTEVFSFVGAKTSAPVTFDIYGETASTTNKYTTVRRLVPWSDGPSCTASYAVDDCLATTNSDTDPSKLLPFPFVNAVDPYIGDGVFFDNALLGVGSYTSSARQYARRELIMVVRHAIHSVQLAFPGTKPIGIGDIGMPNGTTPEGHPDGTHEYGGNIDIAYYIDPKFHPSYGNMVYRQICCDAADLSDWACVDTDTKSAGYGTCVAGSETKHVVDLPRTAMLIAKIAGSGRLRVIGVEAKVQLGIEGALDQLVTEGKITASEQAAAVQHIATANDDPSWVWHFNHMHASLVVEATSAAAFRIGAKPGLWPNMDKAEQAARMRAFVDKAVHDRSKLHR